MYETKNKGYAVYRIIVYRKRKNRLYDSNLPTPGLESAYTRIQICLYSDFNLPIPGLESAYTQISICL
jgi:hypothetical protein